MKNINPILHRISIFYYIFIALYILASIYGMSIVIVNSVGPKPSPYINNESMISPIFFIAWSLISLAAIIWYFVVFIKLLTTVSRSIKRKNIFNLRTVKLINHNVIVNGVMLILIFIAEISFKTSIDKNSLSLFEDIITGSLQIVMMLIFGQVLKIGYILKQEQKLTI